MIAEKLHEIEERIRAACLRAGRSREEVQLLAVSKTQPAERLKEAYDLGLRLFGENKAQEYTVKAPLLPEDIHWHFIGNLQKNKVKYLVGRVDTIHSVNSEGLADEIERLAARRDVIQDILVEVNVAGEASKQGAALDEARALARYCHGLPHIKLRGLMTVAPVCEDPSENRPVFAALRELKDELAGTLSDPDIRVLSMGMSDDFEVAIEEGATLVRLGSALFGPRYYPTSL